jgi:hypothetical protein
MLLGGTCCSSHYYTQLPLRVPPENSSAEKHKEIAFAVQTWAHPHTLHALITRHLRNRAIPENVQFHISDEDMFTIVIVLCDGMYRCPFHEVLRNLNDDE